MIFLQDSLRLSAVSLARKRNDILDFSCCPLSRVLHVTLANWQTFGFEFHLRSSSSAYSAFVNISRPAEHFTACYTVLKRLNKVETAVHGCNLACIIVSWSETERGVTGQWNEKEKKFPPSSSTSSLLTFPETTWPIFSIAS